MGFLWWFESVLMVTPVQNCDFLGVVILPMVAFLFEIIVLIPFYSHEITGKMMLRHGALGDLPKELGPYGTNGLRGSFTTISRYSRGGYHWKALCQSWSCGRNFSMLICPSIPSTLCASCFNTSADLENIPGKNWKDQES
jgi:hypothetical protein